MPSFVFQYRSFTVCLPTVGPEMALSCRHILPLNIDISGKTWVWGSFPFPRASKLEMSCSGTLVKLLLIWHKLAKLATFCFWSISHFWTLRLSTYSHWESTWDEDAHTNFCLFKSLTSFHCNEATNQNKMHSNVRTPTFCLFIPGDLRKVSNSS